METLVIRFIFESSDVQNAYQIDSGRVTFGNIEFIFEQIKNTWMLAN